MSAQPRLVVSAPSSGHGKTAIAVGLLAAAVARGITSAGFKVGPDHTDAAYLGLAAGRPGRNLDPRLVGPQRIAPLFAHGAAGAQLAVIEGAMGLFDSLTGQPEIDGTAAVAATLRAPVVLVIDVAAMGHSLAALVHGFRMFDEMVRLGGVILNRVASGRHEQMLRTALDDIGMPVLGALRRGDLPDVLPARAHGPVPVAHRSVDAGRAVRRLGEAIAAGIDLERLMALAGSAPALPGPIWTPAEAVGGETFEQRPIVALAGGPGAPYTYVETAELLTAAGAEVAVVDPLRDESLPAGTRALVVGAGLPEGYAEELSANRRLCNAVAKFAHDGWPIVAEGVALPWLGRDFDGRPMCAVFDASATTGDQTVAGYREATAPTTSPLAPAGARITGYKQHRALVTPRAGTVPAWTWSGGNPEGFVWRQVHASQLGLHWAAAPEIAKRLIAAAVAGPQSAPTAPMLHTQPSYHDEPTVHDRPAPHLQPVMQAQSVVSVMPYSPGVAQPVGQLEAQTQQFPPMPDPVVSGIPPAGSPPIQGQVVRDRSLGGSGSVSNRQTVPMPPQQSGGGSGQPHQGPLQLPQSPHQASSQQGPHQPASQQRLHQLDGVAGLSQFGQRQLGGAPELVQPGSRQPGSSSRPSQGPHSPEGPLPPRVQPGSAGSTHGQPPGPRMLPGPPSAAVAMPVAGSPPPAVTPAREPSSYETRGLADTADIPAS